MIRTESLPPEQLRPETAEDFRKQQTAFSVLTLFVLAMLLFLHTLAASVVGEPSLAVVGILGLSFALRLGELVWLQTRTRPLNWHVAKIEGAASILSLFLLTLLLAWLTDTDHSPYQVLLAIPVLQSAFLFGLGATVLTILAADGAIFLWLDRYFVRHPPGLGTEYLEAAMLSIVFALMGILVWLLVSQLRSNETALASTLSDLEAAREQLLREEKLAAVGRLASGIAHEIRNPVAMITSALATAAEPSAEAAEREEMLAIALRQADRLEALTTDFLTYARPSVPRRQPILVGDLLAASAAVTRVQAAGRNVEVDCPMAQSTTIAVDVRQVEGALLNLTLNAMDATPESGRILLRARLEPNVLHIDVENSGAPIPDADLKRIFEPFFTTKPAGTGLGLAIARGVARAHGGDLWVSANEDGRVIFTLTLAADLPVRNEQEVLSGQSSDRG